MPLAVIPGQERACIGKGSRYHHIRLVLHKRSILRRYCLHPGRPATPRLRWGFAEGPSIQHPEPSNFMKPKPHRRLRYGSFFGQEDSFDLAPAKVLEIAVRPNAADLSEGSRQSTLVDTSDAA